MAEVNSFIKRCNLLLQQGEWWVLLSLAGRGGEGGGAVAALCLLCRGGSCCICELHTQWSCLPLRSLADLMAFLQPLWRRPVLVYCAGARRRYSSKWFVPGGVLTVAVDHRRSGSPSEQNCSRTRRRLRCCLEFTDERQRRFPRTCLHFIF